MLSGPAFGVQPLMRPRLGPEGQDHGVGRLGRLTSPSSISLPRYGSRVGLRIVLFEACSAFARVTACTLALSPYIVTRYPKASATSLPPWLLRLLPAGAIAGWDLHPLESAAFPRRTPTTDSNGIGPGGCLSG